MSNPEEKPPQGSPYGENDQHLPQEAWHVIQKKGKRKRVSMDQIEEEGQEKEEDKG